MILLFFQRVNLEEAAQRSEKANNSINQLIDEKEEMAMVLSF